MQKYNKTYIAIAGAVLQVLVQRFSDNVYVQIAVAVGAIFGVYVMPNKD